MVLEVRFTGQVILEIPEKLRPVLFKGKDITERLWELAGAFDGCTLRVGRKRIKTEQGITEALELKVLNKKLLQKPMVRRIFEVQDDFGIIDVIENVEFYLKEEYRGQGIGKSALLIEAIAANDLGFDRIWAIAAGGSVSGSEDIGYKVWPKFGYDAPIPGDILARMPQSELIQAGLDLTKPVLLSMLLDSGLYGLWEQYGEGCHVEFDVSSLDSWSMKRLLSLFEGNSTP